MELGCLERDEDDRRCIPEADEAGAGGEYRLWSVSRRKSRSACIKGDSLCRLGGVGDSSSL